jgi:hypothetical protein
MYALIYDEHDLKEIKKCVLSLHETRKMAETALEDRKKELGRKIRECNTRIVWIEEDIKVGEFATPGQFTNWRPGEDVPHGEMYSDTD